ncbi:unnamed protein product [Echinostoma caproni]|uniref:Ig-like domain-containing protein n=1 Tax=Echinostoma caproni TaxID=27848 RepID=A0A183A621_9TREM|nr:unnamed protein product [Echinostoma caproni]
MDEPMWVTSFYLSIIVLTSCVRFGRPADIDMASVTHSARRSGILLNLSPNQRGRLGSNPAVVVAVPVQSDQSALPELPHPLLSDPLFDSSILTDDAGRVIQSSECTPQERQNRIQCFDKLPDEKYAVSLGNTVNMQCVVLNQHGKVQWRAKKILLGEFIVGGN